MMNPVWKEVNKKILSLENAKKNIAVWQQGGAKVVFTNGCFDILHYGHLHYLAAARSLGDYLIIGLNSEASVKRLKGNHRPIQDDLTRQHTLASLSFVDMVVEFEEDTPLKLITALSPDILVKGGDYQIETIVGAKEVLSLGGRVEVLPFVSGYSTTNIEQKIKNA